MLEVSVSMLASGQETLLNPLTCCDVINSFVISLEQEHGTKKNILHARLCSHCYFGLPLSLGAKTTIGSEVKTENIVGRK